jgi:hypothetical protein
MDGLLRVVDAENIKQAITDAHVEKAIKVGLPQVLLDLLV